MIEATAESFRRDQKELLDAINRGEHIRIERRGRRNRNAVVVPEDWHQEADRALAIVRGLFQLGTAGTNVQTLVEALMREGDEDQTSLFNDRDHEVMATAS
ncbi:hypothetical protein GCM10010470_67090 [Saccharopolyspora taberi]|uniref:Antitoxin n=1 Tax=Saccharopolyspora taberi TaxID=60895 RepID=A0ABN3VNE7_9PSEU